MLVLHNSLTDSELSFSLTKKYLKFIEIAQDENGDFANVFLNRNKKIGEHSDDAFARAIWALGYTVNKSKDKKLTEKAEDIYDKAFPNIKNIKESRAQAFAIIGLYHHYQKYGRKRDFDLIKELADNLIKLYKKNSSNEWNWFEKHLSYANARLPEAMFLAH